MARDAHLVSPLHRAFDFAFHRKTGLKRVFELPCGRGAPRQFAGESESSFGRDDDGLDAVAGGDLENAVLILQFVDLDHGLAFAADIDESDLRADGDNLAVDRLP